MKRVLCAMSGGVDSSVAALLLLEQGYEVIGVTMVLTPFDSLSTNPSEDELLACSKEAADARKVAQRLGIEHIVVDYRSLFSDEVMMPFCRAYISGFTPNPCIECNKQIKFGILHKLRIEMDCDFLATGHYAQIKYNDQTRTYELHKAVDLSKDQSYVLYHIDQDLLAHTLFPLGAFTKVQTRKIALDAGFELAQKAESQDICFIPDGDYASFIEQFISDVEQVDFKPEPGLIVDVQGRVLGTHRGLLYYTIGQRKGLGVAVGEPLFVLEKNTETNTLVVGRSYETGIESLYATKCSFPSHDEFFDWVPVQVKINYRARMRNASALYRDNQLIVRFDEPIRGAAPGQAIVLYEGDRVVAGGTIASSLHD